MFSKQVSGGRSVMVRAGMNVMEKPILSFWRGGKPRRATRRHYKIIPFTKANIKALGIRKLKWPAKSPDLGPNDNV
ncbi:Protein Y45F10D.1 [Phytophthora palmivora]|uniref:Protein Y45F10D.1 n=1 Tax=Phytophthora palmivora TaxID=4796 RepID=A0A2P4Y127_9STRA|nr:Protein Y45F10D.1 [Phytophthora palmivora]